MLGHDITAVHSSLHATCCREPGQKVRTWDRGHGDRGWQRSFIMKMCVISPLQHCSTADHTPTAECVDTAALTVPAAPLQHCRRQTSARWRHGAQLSNCESLVSTFLYSSHRLLLLLLLSRLTMRLHCAICLLKNW